MVATKNISCVKSEGIDDHSTVTRWLQNFTHSVCKNLDDQTRSGRPKNIDSEAVLKAIETNLASSTQRVSGKLVISLSHMVHHLRDLSKSI